VRGHSYEDVKEERRKGRRKERAVKGERRRERERRGERRERGEGENGEGVVEEGRRAREERNEKFLASTLFMH
jgi:hypothetical protein